MTLSTPSAFLAAIHGKPVEIRLSNSTEMHGTLSCLDGFMNVALEQAEERGPDGREVARYQDVFVRGNNVLYIAPHPA